jgi:hypothetical protein
MTTDSKTKLRNKAVKNRVWQPDRPNSALRGGLREIWNVTFVFEFKRQDDTGYHPPTPRGQKENARRRKETLVLSKLLVVCPLENFSFQNVIRDYDVLDTYQVSFLIRRISSSPIESVQKETLLPIFGSLAEPGEGGSLSVSTTIHVSSRRPFRLFTSGRSHHRTRELPLEKRQKWP